MADIVYTVNQDSPESITGVEQISQPDSQLINQFEINTLFDRNKNFVELHIFDLADNLLESDYNYTNYKELGNAQSAGKEGASILTVDPIEDIKKYRYDNGDVKLLYHFLNDLFTPDKNKATFFIQDISTDRTELKLQTFDVSNEEINTYVSKIKSNLTTQSYFSEFRLNFQNNDLFIGVNIDILIENGSNIVTVKLYEPLPTTYNIKSTLSIVEIIADSTAFEVDSNIETLPEEVPYLRPANFNLETSDNEIIPTQYLNYQELFSYPVNNTNSQVYSLFSEKGAELSIDHTDYKNFIHFSSAYERLANFKYKLQLLENYSSSISEVGNATSQSIGITGSISYYNNLTEGILNNFDHYERFLYYESSSYAWPKSNTSKPYINIPTGNPSAITWYASQLALANKYDLSNLSAVINTIPSFLREDINNENYLTFVHMIGQHFDNLWIYTKGVSDKYNADNRLDFGISKDLIGEVLKNFGVKLYTSNKSTEDLFSSFIGQAYQSGSEVINYYITGSVTGSNTSIEPSSIDSYQKEIYKRLYHNLPLLLKSKGTERGLRALINCFGIPSDILDIKYYGGRNVDERPFYGDYKYYTSSLDKIRLDNTGSLITGNTLSAYTSMYKRDLKYTDDLHAIEVGFSPTDSVDNHIVSYSLATGSLSNFNIDNYIGDPRSLTSNTYGLLNSTGSIIYTLSQLTNEIMSSSDAYDVFDYVRLIKFFDNTVFKMVRDFIPARVTADTGIIIKPHLLQRNKAKSPFLSGSRPEFTGSIGIGLIEGGNGGAFKTVDVNSREGEWDTSYAELIQTPLGIGIGSYHRYQEARFDGEFENSSIVVTVGELNNNNPFKTPIYFANNFDVNRWLNFEGLCILNKVNTYADLQGGIYYSSSNNTFYLDSGSWNSNALFTGLSQVSMQYQITSSGMSTGSFTFPFNTSNYANYTTHSLTASNTGVSSDCTSSVNIQVAICDISTTSAFRSSVKLAPEPYNVSSWFVTGPQNATGNINLNILNTTTNTSTYNGLLSAATAVQFAGSLGDIFSISVRDIQIPLTCTYTFPLSAGACNIVPQSPVYYKQTRWNLGEYLGTQDFVADVNNYGLAKFFLGENPDNIQYRIRVYTRTSQDIYQGVVHLDIGIGPGETRTGTFYSDFDIDIFKYEIRYEPTGTPGTGHPVIIGNVALFKIDYTPEYIVRTPAVYNSTTNTQIPNQQASSFHISITAEELPPDCTPFVVLTPPPLPAPPVDPICCFTGDTLITLADRTTIRIDAIKVGDKVLSFNEITHEELSSEVLAIASPTKNDIVTYRLSNGTVVEATIEHPIWVIGKGWSSFSPSATDQQHSMQVDIIEEGDVLLTEEGNQVTLVYMELNKDREYEKVYNFKLKEHYTYYANRILVHNKDQIGGPSRNECIYSIDSSPDFSGG